MEKEKLTSSCRDDEMSTERLGYEKTVASCFGTHSRFEECQLVHCELPYEKTHITRNGYFQPISSEVLRPVDSQLESLDVDPAWAVPLDDCRPVWHTDCNSGRSWARDIQLSHPQILDKQKLWANAYCFNPQSLGWFVK